MSAYPKPPLGPLPDLRMTPAEAIRVVRPRIAHDDEYVWRRMSAGDPLALARAWGCDAGYEAAWLVLFMETNATPAELL